MWAELNNRKPNFRFYVTTQTDSGEERSGEGTDWSGAAAQLARAQQFLGMHAHTGPPKVSRPVIPGRSCHFWILTLLGGMLSNGRGLPLT